VLCAVAVAVVDAATVADAAVEIDAAAVAVDDWVAAERLAYRKHSSRSSYPESFAAKMDF
jgi:hypothetical protein